MLLVENFFTYSLFVKSSRPSPWLSLPVPAKAHAYIFALYGWRRSRAALTYFLMRARLHQLGYAALNTARRDAYG